MNDFEIHDLRKNTVLYLYSQRDQIWTDPPYQRLGDIWTLDKKQLLMDSIINGFDIPKLYFRDYVALVDDAEGNPKYRYAIIDGKQRLTSIWQFIEGRYALSEGFEYLRDPEVNAAGLTYSELATQYPGLRLEFDQTPLPVVTIVTNDEEIIEDLFSRLNEAVSLSAAEKRNAFGGPIPPLIRELVQHKFFIEKVPFSNSRYRHYDLAAKMLLFEHEGKVADTKKAYLDNLVRGFKGRSEGEALNLAEHVNVVLDKMAGIFVDQDSLLESVGMIALYFLLFRAAFRDNKMERLTRRNLQRFEHKRLENRQVASNDIAQAEYALLEFDRYAQSPNDGFALEFRLNVLQSFVHRDEMVTIGDGSS